MISLQWNSFMPMKPQLNLLSRVAIAPFVLMIKLYKWVISPMLGPKCRYTPTCSQYALDALNKYGMIKGLWKALHRISRCHPWGGSGYDPA
jgi:putative membrane protein insertion efficiency factor